MKSEDDCLLQFMVSSRQFALFVLRNAEDIFQCPWDKVLLRKVLTGTCGSGEPTLAGIKTWS